jgi:hypothetical protein
MNTDTPIARVQKTILVTGDQRSGWHPVTDMTNTAVREVLLNIEIQFDGFGYLLCYSSADGLLFGDTWHESEHEAKQIAFEEFGVHSSEWRHT